MRSENGRSRGTLTHRDGTGALAVVNVQEAMRTFAPVLALLAAAAPAFAAPQGAAPAPAPVPAPAHAPPSPAPTSATAPAPSPTLQLDVRREKLENGLRVVLSVDHTSPTIAVDVIYDVGGRNEESSP